MLPFGSVEHVLVASVEKLRTTDHLKTRIEGLRLVMRSHGLALIGVRNAFRGLSI